MDRWDILMMVVAGYLAVMGLVRLMAARRAELIEQVRTQIQNQPNPSASASEDSVNPGDAA